MGEARVLPELARSLRSLGALHDVWSDAAHNAIFAPLLDARAKAQGESVDVLLDALRGDTLFTRIEALSVAAAVQGITHAPRSRALTAQTIELLGPLRLALLALDTASGAAARDDAGWDIWVGRLRTVFVRADEACQLFGRFLAARPPHEHATGWFRRAPR